MADQTDEDIANGNSDESQFANPSSNKDILDELNRTQGAGMSVNGQSSESQSTTEKPAAAAPVTAQPEKSGTEKKEEPAKEATSTKSTSSSIPRDPEWANRGNKTQSTPATEAAKTPEGESVKTDAKPGEQAGAQAFTRLSELTEGAVKSEKDFVDLVNHYNELVTAAQEGFKPKFRNDAHKHAFELLASAAEGKELETGRRTLHTLSLDTSTLKGKDLLFQGFLLDPDNADLSGDPNAREIFEKWYEKSFSDPEDVLIKRNIQKAERQAKELIEKTQKDFKDKAVIATEEPKVDPKVMQSVKNAVDGFGGFKLAFSENAPEDELLNIPVDDPKEFETLERYVTNPQNFWSDLMQQFTGPTGFDYPGFVGRMYEFMNLEKTRTRIFEHGKKMGQRAQVNRDRNSSTREDTVLQNSRNIVAPKKEPASFVEAFGVALGRPVN